ncbi:diaminopimelate epimerase [Bdellovibrio bacteriovorus]|uniref:Diaminopimelate epimerase n=1 Tax=Bdellovibrio bacteriovorus TaxID=959 RepID=A0A150WQH6_BDEBC|nr:diaminopimelate epimerase [Bdellovibrio bacteriovorus]KYG66753.1 diaminopimelate epimerase [Bdellovibrio bacteriovorus]
MKFASGLAMTKMSGAGNTFALIDAREGSAFAKQEAGLKNSRRELVKKICSIVDGVSTDGVLFIGTGSSGFDFNWDFYNSDGSTAEMCGNAARCAARFVADGLGFSSAVVKFKTGAGLITTESLPDRRIRVIMSPVKIVNENLELKTHTGASEKFFFVNTGVPHLVQKIHNLADRANLKEMAKEVRSHTDLGPAGSNVTFYVETSSGKIEAVTYERGVEDYTLACGTGAVAAAMAHAKESNKEHIEVKMPGGLLEVDFPSADPHPRMTGEAVAIADLIFNTEVFR